MSLDLIISEKVPFIVVSGHKSGTVLCTIGYIKRGKGTPGMFDPVL